MTVIDNPALPKVLTVDELATWWRVHPDSVKGLIRSGALRATRIGKQYRIVEADALAYFNGNMVVA
ncbi:DNA binding domain%2C excisionase family [Mycobacteroides abscessus]|uniref:helix-turn-helix domain-containing protein n=1 Tax=Mycobacteroides abscessus TaxID=36809 RepID=UPI0005DC2D84|nr:helix-turn-helix domain-containing protein [Mycobacteroides abscessus]CPS10421.1 DNA binding domain%2C excisionase family [Mycobacteroides abscessus]CPS50172.1 DNA binding domain%2C excisionase family [Mycobacteroides abscessus]CPS93968.1 DNA binding domain%2C excisionase family [Mycobacteroides abscessus]CPS94053.1 DNA binding domain%2C excisionase family [Mycobacteroides abscessus]CPT62142.1 DNA binding domain%2C excisionase family [Mycobacteroides abscessus]